MTDTTLEQLEKRATAHRDRPSYGHDALITCDRLVRIFASDGVEVQALQGLDLLVKDGELMALVGASGSGKSTLMNILAGLDVPSAGAARVAGRDLLAMDAKARLRYRREVVGFVWQQTARNLLPYLTAAQNVALPMQLSGGPRGRRRKAERVRELLSMLGVADCRDRRPAQMSGGQQQRTAIAVALANSPAVLLADEPTGELDSATGEQVFAAFRRANEELGTTIVIVTHDQAVAGEVRRTVAIRDGRTSSEVLRRTEIDAQGQESVVARRHAGPGRPAPTPRRLHGGTGHGTPGHAGARTGPHRHLAGHHTRTLTRSPGGVVPGPGACSPVGLPGRGAGGVPRPAPSGSRAPPAQGPGQGPVGVRGRPPSPPVRTAIEPKGVRSLSHAAPADSSSTGTPGRRKPRDCAACTARNGRPVPPTVRDQISRPIRSRSARVRRSAGSASSRSRNSATAAATAPRIAETSGSPGSACQPPRGGRTPAHGGPVTAPGTANSAAPSDSSSSPAETVTSRCTASASRAVRMASTSKDGGRPKTASASPCACSRTAAARS